MKNENDEIEITFKKVKKIIAEYFEIDESLIKPETSLIEDIEADSLDKVEIIMLLDDAFNIDIPDEEMDNLITIKDIVDSVERLNK